MIEDEMMMGTDAMMAHYGYPKANRYNGMSNATPSPEQLRCNDAHAYAAQVRARKPAMQVKRLSQLEYLSLMQKLSEPLP